MSYTISVDTSKARNRMALRARAMRDVAWKPLERAADAAAARARDTTSWNDRTGKTRRSIRARASGVQSSVRVRGAGSFLEWGTRAHVIRARNAKFLRFTIGGEVFFRRSVKHPGTKATHFMLHAAEDTRPQFVRDCINAAHRAIANAT